VLGKDVVSTNTHSNVLGKMLRVPYIQ